MGTLATTDTPVIRTHGLVKEYPRVRALDDLTVTVPAGITGVVGVNGAGKSTLIKIVLGLLTPTAGRVEVLGFDPGTDGPAVRERVGYMPEHDCLPLDVSAAEAVTHLARMSGLPAGAARERSADILRHVGVGEERHRAMGGYSTGMKQRVKLAQAIVHDPPLVLLDEPTNGLDPRSRDEMLDLIRRVGIDFGISVVVTSHLLGEIERTCDYLVVVDAGRLMRASETRQLTHTTGTVLVEVLGPPGSDQRLGQRLLDLGLTAWPDGDRVQVRIDDPRAYDVIRDATIDLDLDLVSLREVHHSLDEIFTRQPTRTP